LISLYALMGEQILIEGELIFSSHLLLQKNTTMPELARRLIEKEKAWR